MSAEFDALMASTQLEREKADGIKSLIAASRLAAGYQRRAEVAEAALARVEDVCVIGTRVATERMVSGSVVHVAAKDAIDTFAHAIRAALETKP